MIALQGMRMKKSIIAVFLLPIFCFIAANEKGSVVDAMAQVIKPGKALLRGYAPEDVPAESGIYFQLVAQSYNARIKRDILGKVRQSAAQGNSHAKELLYLFNELPNLKGVKQVIAMLTRSISAHQSMIADNTGHNDTIVTYDRVYSALLLQSSVVLTNQARDQLLAILEEINSSLSYWKDQKNHPIHYFFHKSPLKWVTGKSQTEEIASNIKKLERLEYSIHSILGRMTHHVYKFNPNYSVDELYDWTEELLTILFCIGKYEDKPEHETRFDKIAAQLRFKVSHVDNLTNTVFEKMAFAKKPSHYVRNWMVYTAAMIALYKGYGYYTENTDLVTDALQRSLESIQGLWQSVTDPVTDAWKTVFGQSLSEENRQKEALAKNFQAIEAIIPEFKKNKDILERLIEEGQNQTTFKDAALSDLEKLLEQTWSFAGWTSEEKDLIKNSARENNLKPLRDAILQVGVVTNTSLRTGLERVAKELEFATVLDSLPVLQNIIGNVVDIGWSVGQISDYYIDFIDKLIKSQELNIKFAALIPAVGLGFGASKLYNWVTARDYSAVRLALIEINSLFIEAKAPLGDADYGKLIYLLQGLKNKAMRYLPVKENLRDDFLADIAKLESQQFSVETKRRIIKNMFNKYPFLSFNVKSA